MARLLRDETLFKLWSSFFIDTCKSDIETLALSYPDKRSLYIDYDTLDEYNPELAEGGINEPFKYIYNGELAIKDIDTAVGHINLHLRVTNLPHISKHPIRELRSEHMGKLVSVEGLAKKHTTIRAGVQIGKFQCQKCGAIIAVEQNEDILKEPSECYEEQGGCGRTTSFKFLSSLSTFIDGQKVQLQENPEGLRGGEQPEKIIIFLEDDLVGKIYPGDRVRINGILHGIERRRGATQLSSFDFGIDTCSIEINESIYEDIEITEEDKNEIHAVSKDSFLYEKIKNSIAPTIYGLDVEKKALKLQLFGGVPKVMPDGTKIRGDIHILFVGDPGTAKSQIIHNISRLSPRSIFCTGKGSSAAGLTAAAVKDDFGEGQWTLEAGALVLADGGIACIDEIDKMNTTDRDALHPAMEQQEIHIAKAGINATLKTRCSILSAANPKYGRFDEYAPIPDQIDMPVTLLSRYDLIFPILDKPNQEYDSELADHILNVHKNPDNKNNTPNYSPEFLAKYVAYAKQNINPKLTDNAHEQIKSFYLKMRNISQDSVSITPRQLEAIIRLSEASARVRLCKEISVEDVDRAISIMEHYLKSLCVDFETGKPDIDILTSGYSHTQQERMKTVVKIIRETCTSDKGAAFDDIIKEAEIVGIPPEKTEAALNRLKHENHILEVSKGRYRLNET